MRNTTRNIHGLMGLIVLVIAEILVFKGVEPFASWFYYLAWWPYILIVDSLIYRIKKNSLIINRRGEFFLLLFWSVFFWTFFESVNLIMKNWYYCNVVPVRAVRWPGYAFAYATVLPGLFETTELLESLGLFKNSRVKPIAVNRLWSTGFLFLGIVFFSGVILYPSYCFPLIWVCFIFLLEPLNYRWGGKSLLRDWERGDLSKVYLLLAAGLICGILWEFWNFWATTKWIYTVPFFEELKLFEMPVLGFLGFPPFSVECYVMYNFVSLFRYKRGWEENTYRLHPDKNVKFSWRFSSSLVVIAFCLLTFNAIDEKTVNSYWPDLKELQSLPPAAVAHLSSLGVRTPKELLAKAESDEERRKLVSRLKVSDHEIAGWVHLAELACIKEMGTRNAHLLSTIGIAEISLLATSYPAALYKKLLELHQNTKGRSLPREAILSVWVRAAQHKITHYGK